MVDIFTNILRQAVIIRDRHVAGQPVSRLAFPRLRGFSEKIVAAMKSFDYTVKNESRLLRVGIPQKKRGFLVEQAFNSFQLVITDEAQDALRATIFDIATRTTHLEDEEEKIELEDLLAPSLRRFNKKIEMPGK